MDDPTTLELTFALKHLDQHLQTNDSNVKKLLKLQQRIVSKESQISCKGAVKIYQAYESLLQDIEKNIATVDHVLRFCEPSADDDDEEADSAMEVDQSSRSDRDIIMKQSPLPAESSSAIVDELVGKLVAALTLTAEGTEEWILARVCAGRGDGTFEVEDAEVEGEPEEKELYTVKKENMILVPESDEAALEQVEFKLRQNVLALFPGTTCFYSAVVMSTPSRRRKTRDYLLKFADDDVPNRQCSPRFILPFFKK